MKRLFFACFLLTCFHTHAESVNWRQGILVLKDQQVLVGNVIVQPALNVILFSTGTQSTFYHLDQVEYVTYHDPTAGLKRKFISLPGDQKKGDRMFQLYEVVLMGRIAVIRKPIHTTYIPAVDDVGSFEYFVLENEQLVQLTQFRKKIFPGMEASYSAGSLKLFMRRKRLDPNRNSDAIRLIEYYNDGTIASESKLREKKSML